MNTKKIFRALMALMFAVCTIFALSSCDALGEILDQLPIPGMPDEECTHTMEETAYKAATCEGKGNIKFFTCSTCNKVFKDEAGTIEITLADTVILAKGHKEKALAAKAPTCTENGLTEGKKCSVCDRILVAQTDIDALGHTEEDLAAVAPTCTATGLTAGKKCTVCNTVTVAQEEVAMLAHALEDVSALAPTCTTDGYTAHKACTVCDYTEDKQTVDEIGHNVVGEANVAATCTKDGFIGGKYCSICEEVFFAQKVVPALGHDNVVIDVVEAGCAGPGLQFVSCNRCGFEENVIVPEFHDVVEVAAKQVTCYEDGNTDYKYCTLCDWSEGKEIFIGEHKGEWISVDACYERLICTVCERAIKRETSTVIDFEGGAIYDDGGKLSVAVGALSGAAGDEIVGGAIGLDAFGNPRTQYSLVTDAGNKVLKVIHNQSADYAASYTYLSYTDAANTTADGKYLVFDFDLKLNGVLNSGTPTIFAIGIYDESGNAATSLSVTCYGGSENLRIAGANITAKTDGKVGDKATMWVSIRIVTTLDDVNTSGRYSTVTEVYAKAKDSEDPYKYITRVTKTTGTYGGVGSDYSVRFTHDTNFSSSTQKTINYYLDNLSFIRTSSANYLYNTCNHVFSDWSVTEAVKCESDGEATRSCTVDGCGYTEIEYLPAHKLTVTPAKAATCAEAGYTMGEKCSECDYEIASTPIAKLAHTAGDEATCTTAKTCTVCGEEIEAALGHSEVTDEAVAATCTTAGKSEGKHCSVCGEVLVAQNVVPALGHDMDGGVYIIVPNCTESGTIKYTCKRNCGHSVIEEVTSAHDIVSTPGKDATCYEDGYTAAESCTLCDYTKESVVIRGGHKGEWVPIDTEYEQLACTVCDRIQRRERNNVIADVDFSNSASDKRIDFTDARHAISDGVGGGKYLVFDFDVVIDKSDVTGTTEYLFDVKILDGAASAGFDGNLCVQFQIIMKNNVILVGGSGTDVNPVPYANTDERCLTFRVVAVLDDAKNDAGKYESYYYIYAKETGSDGPMTLVREHTNTSSYAGCISRYDNYKALLSKTKNYNYVSSLKNASFIRTNDTNYLYNECNHEMSDWAIEKDAVTCTEDGVATRFCTVDGCGYTETEYISAHNLTTTSGKAATCLEAGYTAYSVCADCEMMIGKLDLPILGHVISDWVDVDGGAKQKKTCQNGCGYYEIRTVADDNPITFDDGTVTDGGRLSYVNVNYGEDNKTAVSLDSKSDYSISKDITSATNSLCVHTVNNSTGNAHAKVSIPVTDGSEAGNVYTFDFDMYIVPGEDSTNNSSRIATSIIFGGAGYSIGVYGSNVGAYTSNKGEYGKINTWIGFRFIYTVMVDGEATLEILVRDANGVYNTVRTTTVKSSAIKVSGVDGGVTVSSYSVGTYTYYLDNISLTRHTAGYEIAE